MVPIYLFKCIPCGATAPSESRTDCICHECGTPMVRDYKAENVGNTFKPTQDLYAKKKKVKK